MGKEDGPSSVLRSSGGSASLTYARSSERGLSRDITCRALTEAACRPGMKRLMSWLLVSLSFLFLGLPRVGRAAEQAFEDAALLSYGLSLFFDLVHVFLALAEPKGHFPFQAIAADAQSHGLTGAVFTQPAVRMSRKSGAT